MQELLKAFPTVHQERKLTSLEKGRMVMQILDDVSFSAVFIADFSSKTTMIKL